MRADYSLLHISDGATGSKVDKVGVITLEHHIGPLDVEMKDSLGVEELHRLYNTVQDAKLEGSVSLQFEEVALGQGKERRHGAGRESDNLTGVEEIRVH
jgi:hypothetical protein